MFGIRGGGGGGGGGGGVGGTHFFGLLSPFLSCPYSYKEEEIKRRKTRFKVFKTIQVRKKNPNSPRICVFVGLMLTLILFWFGLELLGYKDQKMCKETCRYFRGSDVHISLKPVFFF